MAQKRQRKREKEAAETGRSWEAEDEAKACPSDKAEACQENEAEANRKAEAKACRVEDKACFMATKAENSVCSCTWIDGCTCGATKTQDEAEAKDYNTCNCTWIYGCTCGAANTTELEETAGETTKLEETPKVLNTAKLEEHDARLPTTLTSKRQGLAEARHEDKTKVRWEAAVMDWKRRGGNTL